MPLTSVCFCQGCQYCCDAAYILRQSECTIWHQLCRAGRATEDTQTLTVSFDVRLFPACPLCHVFSLLLWNCKHTIVAKKIRQMLEACYCCVDCNVVVRVCAVVLALCETLFLTWSKKWKETPCYQELFHDVCDEYWLFMDIPLNSPNWAGLTENPQQYNFPNIKTGFPWGLKKF